MGEPVKKKRGRPRRDAGAAAIEEALAHQFSVAVFLEIEKKPVPVTGKTGRATAAVKPGDVYAAGPVTLTHSITWQDLLSVIAVEVQSEVENLKVTSMAWRWFTDATSRSKQKLPLTNELVVISMMQPAEDMRTPWKSNQKGARASTSAPGSSRHGRSPDSDDEDEPRTIGEKKVSLDKDLQPVVQNLMKKYYIGLCRTHPLIRCFYHAPNDWHFELDSNRVNVWALSIRKLETNYNQIPLTSRFFAEDQTIGFQSRASRSSRAPDHRASTDGPQAPGPLPFPSHLPAHNMWPSTPPNPYAAHQQAPYYGYGAPMGFPGPWQPWSSPLPGLQWSGVPAAAPPPTQLPPTARTLTPADGADRSSPMPSSPITSMKLEEWCEKYEIPSATCAKLRELDFQPGDNLKTVEEKDWKEAGFKLLEWRRVLQACKKYRAAERE
ncbi:hypothetical protein FA95DRAFT_621088 [Auriscalpium vulgare]|uniref:Uncharacterized protein n=1 Tax=Auriscalpium vulgare TaxID=40419 RepID=A0ACB8S1N2_9AGAM|nr:hypothetical protein FA95DRAFT_621088 [Auriscalpium vulgare]